ncbi:MAG: type II secretion system protein [Sedimentisphaerales bacterium]|nr:type II secretion system protein [Sedimentisphaerales bacterium]
MHNEKQKGFTLIELLVVISSISLLLAILMPALSAAKSEARALVCKSNLHQLLLAGIGYATENGDAYVSAASDMWDSSGLNRWHGRRESLDEPFDPKKGPLVDYIRNGKIKECPGKVNFVKGQNWDANFEQGCGGYGYNMTYIGSRLWQSRISGIQAWKDAYAATTHVAEIASPGKTLMFADTAMANDENFLIEYSFAEPPFTIQNGQVVTSFYMSPSIHFRHRDYANIGWADGHIGRYRIGSSDEKNIYGINSNDVKIGWFEPIDNTLFDLH